MGRPKSGVSAPKGRMSLIERFGGTVAEPTPTGQTVSTGQQMASVAPSVEATPAPKKNATPVNKPVNEADEIAVHKKKMEQQKIDKDIKAYAARKAQKEAAAKLAAKKK